MKPIHIDDREGINDFLRPDPGLLKYHNRVAREVKESGKVLSSAGRVRFFPNIYSDDQWKRAGALREAINHPVQSFASDIVLLAMIELETALWGYQIDAPMICQVHDELNYLVPDEHVELVSKLMKETMENAPRLIRRKLGVRFDIPLVADVAVGAYWGEAK